MKTVSRNKSLNIPKQIKVEHSKLNTEAEELSVRKTIKQANNDKYNEKKILEELNDRSIQWDSIVKIPQSSNDLIVITVVKKLAAYIITITEKSPKKFRGVFVNRMQNYTLDTIEDLLRANFIRMDSLDNKNKREDYQKDAIIKLKMLGYISMLAYSSGCTLKKQYKQISIQTAEAISLTTAWKKSDDRRWKAKVNK
jgi:hypothetical protein